MVKIAFVRGGYDKNANEPVKGVFTNSQLAQQVEEFSKKFKILDVQPFGSHMVMIRYED